MLGTNIGIDNYGIFDTIISSRMRLPITFNISMEPTDMYECLVLYEGIHKDNRYNRLIDKYFIDVKELGDITITINDNRMIKIGTKNYESGYKEIKLVKERCNKIIDDIWYKREIKRIQLIEYIVNIKDTLSDEYIRTRIDYEGLYDNIRKVEIICNMRDVYIDEFTDILDELTNYVNLEFKKINKEIV